ncbi:MAG: winged helix-turn-helix domain-containing protein [Candidatus Micrarchaeota archaeon]
MDEDKIVLDRKSFEALAVDSRVRILKSLKQRRKTLSELAKEQKMSISGVKEHLETLEKVNLIKKIDDGHKWKYYELTKKGNEIIGPKEIRVWILLVTAVVALLASFTAMFSVTDLQTTDFRTIEPVAQQEMLTAAMPDNGSEMVGKTAVDDASLADDKILTEPDLTIPNAVAWISGLTITLCVLILIKNRIKT